jgi:hypothetical protein
MEYMLIMGILHLVLLGFIEILKSRLKLMEKWRTGPGKIP